MISYTITDNNIVVVAKGRIFNLDRKSTDDTEKAKANKVYDLLKKKTEASFQEIIAFLCPIIGIENHLKKEEAPFKVDMRGRVFIDDKELPIALGKKLLAFATEELPLEPLIKFWHNLNLNPSQESILDLYAFLDKNHHPITPDGKFIAYKKVQSKGGNLFDSHSGTFNNNVGTHVEIARSKVDADRNQTCSNGLHVASWEYAKGFSGDTLIMVQVHPKDVVAVPIDYSRQKMRCCAYEVLDIYVDDKELKTQVVVPRVKEVQVADKPTSKRRKAKAEKSTSNLNAVKSGIAKIVLTGMTAREVVAVVKQNLGIVLTMNLKNKTSIVNKAKKLFKAVGCKVTV